MDIARYSIPGSIAAAALLRNRVDHVVAVPDWVQLALHDRLNTGLGAIKVINCANENQVVTVAGINTLRAVCIDAHIPMVFMVGQFGREYSNIGHPATQSGRSMVRIAEPLLTAIGIPFHNLDSEADMAKLDVAYEQAEREKNAVVLLVSAPMAWR